MTPGIVCSTIRGKIIIRTYKITKVLDQPCSNLIYSFLDSEEYIVVRFTKKRAESYKPIVIKGYYWLWNWIATNEKRISLYQSDWQQGIVVQKLCRLP